MANSLDLVGQLRQQLEKANAVVTHYERLIDNLKQQISECRSPGTAGEVVLPYSPFFRGPTAEALLSGVREIEALIGILEAEAATNLTLDQQEVLRKIHRMHQSCFSILELLQLPDMAGDDFERGQWSLVPFLQRHLPESVPVEGDAGIPCYANREIIRRIITALVYLPDSCARSKPAALPHLKIIENSARKTVTLHIDFCFAGICLPPDEAFYWLPPQMVRESGRSNCLPLMVLLFAIQALAGQNAGVRISRSGDQLEEMQIVLPQTDYSPTGGGSPIKGRIAILCCPENRRQTAFAHDVLNALGCRAIMLTPAEWQSRAPGLCGNLLLVPLPAASCQSIDLLRELMTPAHRDNPRASLVPIAAFDVPGQREKCLELGALAYFQQPLTLQVLDRLLHEIQEREG